MTQNKILPVALVAALLGGTVGAFVMRPSKSASAPETAQLTKSNLTTDAKTATTDGAQVNPNELAENELNAETSNMTEAEKAAFRDGFSEGVEAARETELTKASTVTRSAAPAASRVVYQPARTRTRTVRRANNSSRRVYYDYGQQKGRSFWQKHRDKLTVAMGAGGGALVGGLVGGKKGAAIGALAGGGGSALYTYKLRKRNRNY
jgi:hypothetical protein